ncbi:MAG TPA: translation elongation factor Ts [Polyangiaceae bacterium]|jgi:elongation factor Ts
MAQVDMQRVKELRDRTQAGLNDCRSALIEAEGDMDKAVEIILKKGLAKSAKRAGSVATEGVIATGIAPDGKTGVIVEVNIQTDFAARNADFLAFVGAVVKVALDVREGADLGAQKDPDGEATLEDRRAALVGRLGENIAIRRWANLFVEGPGRVCSYVHLGGKIGVLAAFKAASGAADASAAFTKFAEDTAMQIAAMAPLYLTMSDIPAGDREKQAEIFTAQLAEEAKVPEARRPQVVEGKVQKWAKEVCLLEQPSILETSQSVDQLRAAVEKETGGSVAITGFVRYQVGEGIDKPQGPDFADEVARMAGA